MPTYVSELQHPVLHPLPDQGDRRAQPGGGGDGRQVQDGGARGLKLVTTEHSSFCNNNH